VGAHFPKPSTDVESNEFIPVIADELTMWSTVSERQFTGLVISLLKLDICFRAHQRLQSNVKCLILVTMGGNNCYVFQLVLNSVLTCN
jgi:hypothetical protein